MIGMLTSALISAVILVFIIRMFTGQDVSFGNAFFAALVAGFVGGILTAIACASLTNPTMTTIIAIRAGINFVVTAVAVQFICSTDLKRVLMIAGTYMVVVVGLGILLVSLAAK